MHSSTSTRLKPSQEKPWMQFFSEEARNATLPEKTIYTCMRENNTGYESNPALNYFGNQISYGKLFESIDAGAAALSELGVKKGDYVTCLSVTIPEVVSALYSANKLGVTFVSMDPRRSAAEIREFSDGLGAKVVFVIDLAYEHVCKALEGTGVEHIVVLSVDDSMPLIPKIVKQFKMPSPKLNLKENSMRWADFLKLGNGKQVEAVPYEKDAVVAVSLTGGTTGTPKGCMYSNDGFNAVAVDFGNCGVKYTRDQRFLNIIPAFTSYGLISSVNMPLYLGLELVLIPKFEPDKVGYYIKKYRPAHTLLVPTYYEKLMYCKEMRNGFDLSFFETAGSGGDSMNEGLEIKLNQFLADHGCKYPLSQGYGLSEASSAVACSCNGNFRSMSVGYPLLKNTIGIFKPGTTEELDYNEEGEICITGPCTMLGYVNRPEENAHVMVTHPDGKLWIHSGDLGYMDEDGYIYIKGRIKRVIARADGHKVFPPHIEDVISKLDSVLTCAVVGVRDREHSQGMYPLAVVVKKPGYEDDFTLADIQAQIEREIEVRGRPCKTILIPEMPYTGMGKIDYLKLAADYEAEQDRLEAAAK